MQFLYELVTVIREFAAKIVTDNIIGKAAVYDDLSARRPALGEVFTATSNWPGMDNRTNYVYFCLHVTCDMEVF